MIARTWLGKTPAHRSDEYLGYLKKTGVKTCRSTPGNRGVVVLRRIVGDQAEFWFISVWDSEEAIRRFAGPQIEKAVYYPEDRDFLLELPPEVSHFEVAVLET